MREDRVGLPGGEHVLKIPKATEHRHRDLGNLLLQHLLENVRLHVELQNTYRVGRASCAFALASQPKATRKIALPSLAQAMRRILSWADVNRRMRREGDTGRVGTLRRGAAFA